MADRASYNQIIIGAAVAEIALYKTSKKPTDAQHETRTFDMTPKPEVDPEPMPTDGLSEIRSYRPGADPTAADPDPTSDRGAAVVEAPDPPRPVDVPTQRLTRTERGVWREHEDQDREWVNLTDELAAIDARNKLDGMEVEFTVPLERVPRRISRDSYFIVPQGPDAARVLAHIWMGLKPNGLAAIVRWTKTTAQYCGAIVASGSIGHKPGPILELIEIEWDENMKQVPPSAVLPAADVPTKSADKASEAMKSLRRGSSALAELRDERVAERRALLEHARTTGGDNLDVTDKKKPEAIQELGDVILSAAA